MKKIIWSRILLGIGISLFVFYVGGLIFFYNFAEYSIYASAGAETDAFIHSVFILPPTIICLLSSLLLWIQHKKSFEQN